MTIIWFIARRELGAYLSTMMGYVIMAVMLALTGLLFNSFAMTSENTSADVLSKFFYFTSGTTIVASVFISMRLLAEERQTGTLPLLYSSPIADHEIVLGKFLSAFLFLGILLLSSMYLPALVFVNGSVAIGQVVCGYLGLLLLGSACIAIGMLGSALAKNQLIAATVSACLLVALLLAWFISNVTAPPFDAFFQAVALHKLHFYPFRIGILHTRDVAYYLLVTHVFLFASVRVLEARRWR